MASYMNIAQSSTLRIDRQYEVEAEAAYNKACVTVFDTENLLKNAMLLDKEDSTSLSRELVMHFNKELDKHVARRFELELYYAKRTEIRMATEMRIARENAVPRDKV